MNGSIARPGRLQLFSPGKLPDLSEYPVAELKTKPNHASVDDFLNAIKDAQVRTDCQAIMEIMQAATHSGAQMWGSSIVGFGSYHYKYASGREADWPLTGFSPRKQNITLYIMSGFEQYEDLLTRLGRYTLGKSCLYIKRLADVDTGVLKQLVQASVDHMLAIYPPGG
jgi:hypothetical protein